MREVEKKTESIRKKLRKKIKRGESERESG